MRPMLRLKASDPGYEEINRLWNLYAIATNPHVWANPCDLTQDDLIEKSGWRPPALAGGGKPAPFLSKY